MRVFRGLINAFSYFTILPVPASEEGPDVYSIAWLPLVGAVVGLGAGWGAYGTFLLTHSQLWSTIAAFGFSVLLTGGIHIDGFLDCCDALLATTSVERRLEILKDAHHGSYAIIGMALLAIVWFAALYELPPIRMTEVLPLFGFLSRAAAIVQIGTFKHARSETRQWPLIVVGACCLIASLLTYEPIVIAAYPIALIWAWLASLRLGGRLTGDVYGAVIVITEVGLLKLLAVFGWIMP